MKIAAKLKMPPDRAILARLNVEKGGTVQRHIDSEVIRLCEPYVPFDNGILTSSAYTETELGSGLIIYNTPYAHYQYYGEVYGPSFPIVIGGEQTFRSRKGIIKHPTGGQLKYHKEVHPQAGSHWFDRAMTDHKDELLESTRKVAHAK